MAAALGRHPGGAGGRCCGHGSGVLASHGSRDGQWSYRGFVVGTEDGMVQHGRGFKVWTVEVKMKKVMTFRLSRLIHIQ